jgi:hypothetical protein
MRFRFHFLLAFVFLSCHTAKVMNTKSLERLKRIEELQNAPFPKKPSFYLLTAFMKDYSQVYRKYPSLLKSLELYEKNLDFKNKDVTKALNFKLNEDWEKTHWVYFSGMEDLMAYLVLRAKNKLQSTKEEFFIKRMKILVYLAEKLDSFSETQKYTKFLKLLYINVSQNIFGRTLTPSKTRK